MLYPSKNKSNRFECMRGAHYLTRLTSFSAFQRDIFFQMDSKGRCFFMSGSSQNENGCRLCIMYFIHPWTFKASFFHEWFKRIADNWVQLSLESATLLFNACSCSSGCSFLTQLTRFVQPVSVTFFLFPQCQTCSLICLFIREEQIAPALIRKCIM